MNVYKSLLSMLATSLLLLFSSCYNDSEEYLYPGSTNTIDCSTVQSTFAVDVKPLLTSQCAISGCHNSASASGGVVLETYAQISAKSDRIKIRAVVEKSMPPSGAMLPSEIAKLKCWIESGSLNN